MSVAETNRFVSSQLLPLVRRLVGLAARWPYGWPITKRHRAHGSPLRRSTEAHNPALQADRRSRCSRRPLSATVRRIQFS